MRFICAGSATGGHLYPALAVADKLCRRSSDNECLFISTDDETYIVRDAGYELKVIDVRGFNRRNMLKNISVLKDLAVSFRQVAKIFDDYRPDAVFGSGGYACGPVMREAHKRKIPAFLHEQNVIPGLANRLSERYADKIFTAFEECSAYFKDKSKLIVTGNPVRKAFLTSGIMHYRERLGIYSKDLVLLIFGGSLGSTKINEVVSDMLISLKERKDITAFFITGKRMYVDILRKLTEAGVMESGKVSVIEYTDRIHEYYSAADLIISRAGALTVSEIAVSGKASILIPSPNVTGNHQYYNAKTLESKNAAILMNEADLTEESLRTEILKLSANRTVLNRLGEAAMKLGHPDATDMIVDLITTDIEGRKKI